MKFKQYTWEQWLKCFDLFYEECWKQWATDNWIPAIVLNSHKYGGWGSYMNYELIKNYVITNFGDNVFFNGRNIAFRYKKDAILFILKWS